MVVEVKGRYVHVRVRKPLSDRGVRFATVDIGRKGHTKLVTMFYPKTGRWIKQSYLFPIKDVLNDRIDTVRLLKNLGRYTEARYKARKSVLKR